MIRRTAIACCLLVLGLGREAAALTLEDLMQDLAARGPLRARFVETRHLGVLDRPLVTEGTLSFTPPDRLIRQDLLPKTTLYRVEGDAVTVEGEEGVQRAFDLRDEPLLAALIVPFRATLQGDLQALQGAYATELRDTPQDWRLTLVPLDPALRRRIEAIAVEGEGGTVRTLTLTGTNRDRVVMELEPL